MSDPLATVKTRKLAEVDTLELAQALAERLAIAPQDWHRLKGNRKARAREQVAMALVYLLQDQKDSAQDSVKNRHPENTDEALVRLQQAVGWLDRSISAPPCPTHGNH